MEKKDTILLLLIIGSIITIIFGIDALRLAFLLAVNEGGVIARMAIGVVSITTIIFPFLILLFNILSLKALDENEYFGTIFGFITLGLCLISIGFCAFFIMMVPQAPFDANIVLRIQGSLAVCIIGQIIVFIGLVLNLIYQLSK